MRIWFGKHLSPYMEICHPVALEVLRLITMCMIALPYMAPCPGNQYSTGDMHAVGGGQSANSSLGYTAEVPSCNLLCLSLEWECTKRNTENYLGVHVPPPPPPTPDTHKGSTSYSAIALRGK